MCSLEKMLIKGVRSFSPDNTTVIEFYKPLTLIVGANGAGKTTIIECLRQATTGELPPNTRSGQSFIHDPRIQGEVEVKAQIKLRLTSRAGQAVVVARSFSLTRKKVGLAFKALDQTVQTYDPQTRAKQATTYRCADMDRLVPGLMGVSPAVLDNVVFVHQEDSNWPLADTVTLKKRFDDLFAATKYTKALEALRKLRLEQAGAAKVARLEAATLAVTAGAAARLKAEGLAAQARVEALYAALEGLEEAAREAEAEAARAGGLAKEAEAALAEANRLGEAASGATRESQRADRRLAEQHGAEALAIPREALVSQLASLEASTAEARSSHMAARRAAEVAGMSVATLAGRAGAADRDAARAAAAADAAARATAARDKGAVEAAREVGVALPAAIAGLVAGAEARDEAFALGDEGFRALKAALQARKEETAALAADARAAAAAADAAASSKVDAASSAAATAKAAPQAKRDQAEAAIAEAGRLREEAARAETAAGRGGGGLLPTLGPDAEAAAEAEVATAQGRVADLTAGAGAGGNGDGGPDALAGRIQELDMEIASVRAARARLADRSELAQKAALATEVATAKRAQAEELVAGAGERLVELLAAGVGAPGGAPVAGGTLPAPGPVLKSQAQAALGKLKAAATEAAAGAAAATAALNHAQGKAEADRAAAAAAATEAASLVLALRASVTAALARGGEADGSAALPVDPATAPNIPTLEAVWAEKVAAAVEKKATYQALPAQARHACRIADEQSACFVCLRPFPDAASVRAFKDTVSAGAVDANNHVNRQAEVVARTRAVVADLRGLVGDYERWVALRATAGRAGGAVEAEAAEAVARAATAKAVADAAAARVVGAERFMQDVVWPACSLAADAVTALAEVARLGFAQPAPSSGQGLSQVGAPSGSTVVQPTATMGGGGGAETAPTATAGGGNARARRYTTVKEADEALQAKEGERARLAEARATALSDLEAARSSLASAQQELHAVRETAAAARAAAAKRAAAEARADELVAAAGRLRSEASAADAEVATVTAALDATIRERDAVRAAGRAAEGAAGATAAAATAAADRVSLLEAAADPGGSGDRVASLEAAQAALVAAKAALADAETKAAAAEAREKDLAVLATSSDVTRRRLEDCLAAVEAREVMGAAEASAAAAEAAAAALGDLFSLRAAAATALSTAASARSDKDRAKGSLTQAEEAAARTAAELAASPQAATAAADHLKRVAEAHAGEAAARDLDKYGKALEAALLAFHSARMRDVNATIKELWQKTYRHGDIDFIQVRADAEGGASGARAGGRSYNYRLVMMAGGAELEMRGRCSAGQKVLACIIVRLALAEVFGLDCGILALDEPTTNLDEPNAAALAEALRAVMDDRRGQSNFQLIVITHDERFAQLLGTRDLADHMWRVRKDERQMSMLVREDVAG